MKKKSKEPKIISNKSWIPNALYQLVENESDLFGINEQRNLDCNIAYVIFYTLLCSTKIVFNIDDRKTRRDLLFAALNSEF